MAAADGAVILWSFFMPNGWFEAHRRRLQELATAADSLGKALRPFENDVEWLLLEHTWACRARNLPCNDAQRELDDDLTAAEEIDGWLEKSAILLPALAQYARQAAMARHVDFSKRGRRSFLIRQLARTWFLILYERPAKVKSGKFFRVVKRILECVDDGKLSEAKIGAALDGMLDRNEVNSSDVVTWHQWARLCSRSATFREAAAALAWNMEEQPPRTSGFT